MVQAQPLRVVMMGGYAVQADARFRRQVETVVAMGHQVTVVEVQPKAQERAISQWAGAELLTVPSPRRIGPFRRQGWRAAPGAGAKTALAYAAFLKREAAWVSKSGVIGLRTRALAIQLQVTLWQVKLLRPFLKAASRWVYSPWIRFRVHSPKAPPGLDPAGHERWREGQLARYANQPRLACWRLLVPQVIDDEIALGPVLDELAPEVIHIHDVYLLCPAIRAAQRAKAAGRRPWVLFDNPENQLGQAYRDPREIAAYGDLEREFIGYADQITTVSPELADLLVDRYGLANQPALVLNAPQGTRADPAGSIRQDLGLGPQVPIMVYGGGINTARGLHTVVAALPQLPGVHFVMVHNFHSHVVKDLESQAESLGVRDRLHRVPLVPHDQVVPYYGSATIGLSPLLRGPNHDIALTNKFLEYIRAGLPVVTSDTPTQAKLVQRWGNGAVYPAGDVPGFVAAARQVLGQAEALSQAILSNQQLQHWASWAAQAEVIQRLYAQRVEGGQH